MYFTLHPRETVKMVYYRVNYLTWPATKDVWYNNKFNFQWPKKLQGESYTYDVIHAYHFTYEKE